MHFVNKSCFSFTNGASGGQFWLFVFKSGIWRAKLAFRLQIFTFLFTNKHLVSQTGISDYNSALQLSQLSGASTVKRDATLLVSD